MLSIIKRLLLPRHSIPITQCACYSTHHIPSKIVNKIAPFVQFLSPSSLFPFHLFSTTPLSYQHTLRFPTTAFCKCSCKIIVSLDVFLSLPSNHTNQIAVSITQNCRLFRSNIITSTFTQKRHSAPHFDSTSTRHPLHHLIDFRPQFLISTLIIFMLLMLIMFKCFILNLL